MVTKAAIEPVWYLPGVAKRFGCSGTDLRRGLFEEAGGMAERDPYLDQLAQQALDADTLEGKGFLRQVFYERVIITRFRSRTSPEPAHVGHRSVGICPRPRHMGHGRFTAKPPCPNETTPRPLHSGHVLSDAPGAAPLP